MKVSVRPCTMKGMVAEVTVTEPTKDFPLRWIALLCQGYAYLNTPWHLGQNTWKMHLNFPLQGMKEQSRGLWLPKILEWSPMFILLTFQCARGRFGAGKRGFWSSFLFSFSFFNVIRPFPSYFLYPKSKFMPSCWRRGRRREIIENYWLRKQHFRTVVPDLVNDTRSKVIQGQIQAEMWPQVSRAHRGWDESCLWTVTALWILSSFFPRMFCSQTIVGWLVSIVGLCWM